jgi:hypothetical protein
VARSGLDAAQGRPPRLRHLRPRAPRSTAPTGWSSTPRARARTTASRARTGRRRRSSTARRRRGPTTGASSSSSATATARASSPGGPDTGVYWVSNTLLQSLTNAQMLGIAVVTLTRVGG